MGKPISSAPINIIYGQQVPKCSLKCHFNYNYQLSNFKGIHKSNEFLYLVEDSNSHIMFNAEKYKLKSISICKPIHQYGGRFPIGEMIIIHENENYNKQVWICIPLKSGFSANSKTTLIDNLVNPLASSAPGDTLSIKSFNLNNLIAKKPFYSYKGSLPQLQSSEGPGGENGDNEINFILYSPDNGEIPISKAVSAQLNKLNSFNYPIKQNNKTLAYNPSGPVKNMSENSDEIYIDCQPTNNEGETLIEKETHSELFNINFSDESLQYSIQIVAGIVIMYILWIVGNIILSKFTANAKDGMQTQMNTVKRDTT